MDGLPKTLDATYERVLLGIDEEKRQFARRLFQCLTVSVRPLRVAELADILAVRFDAGAIPQFNTGWRPGNAEEAVLSACSTLITIVNVDGSQIVQFSHFSVKEYLISERLATGSENLSHYHIVPHMAHSTLAQASLSVLLQLHSRIDKQSIWNFPLADYAAQYWFQHVQFENESSTIQGVTKRLFDPEKPHLSAWVWIYDIDDPWRGPIFTEHPEQPEAGPLYYAVLCGFRWLIEHLIVTYPGDINARGGYYETPLLAAVRKENVDFPLLPQRGSVLEDRDIGPLHQASHSGRLDIVRLLLDHNADVNLPNEVHETPLDWASKSGDLELSQLLVQRGADVHCRTNIDWTPIQRASHHGHLNIVQFLIDSGADVNSRDREGRTPLHSASRQGHVNVVESLIRHGADVNKQSDSQVTPLYLASVGGKLKIVRLLVQQGADVNSRERGGTPLKAAAQHGHLDVVRFLIDSGADVNFRDDDGTTPLHSAESNGHRDVVKVLLEYGADVNICSHGGKTSLDLASITRKPDIAGFLHGHVVLLNGAVITTPSAISPQNMPPNVLLPPVARKQGEGATSSDNEQYPVYTASMNGQLDLVRSLLDCGSGVNERNSIRETALNAASRYGNPEVAKLLIERGADVDSRNRHGWTPLISASRYGQPEVARLLLDHGADVNARTRDPFTALHLASTYGHFEVVQLLLERGADLNAQKVNGQTARHLAIRLGHRRVAELLSSFGENGQGTTVQVRSFSK